RYGSNAADVVELRATADEQFLYWLVRFNFLNAMDSTVIGLAFDLDGSSETGFSNWPRGAQLRTPGTDLFLTAFGKCALVEDSLGERSLAAAGGAIRVGTDENVMEIALPRELLSSSERLRVSGGAGLWDPQAELWMVPATGSSPNGPGNASERPVGAATAQDPAVFNLLFRDDETTELVEVPGGSVVGVGAAPRTFQTARQNEVLAGGTTGDYSVSIELDRLAPGAASDPMLLRRGNKKDFTRIYRSRVDAEGVLVDGNFAVFLSRYQPYAVYLPSCFEQGDCPWPASRPPVLLSLHGGSGNHLDQGPQEPTSRGGSNVYGLKPLYDELEASLGPIVVRVLGRGQRPPWFRGYGELDPLEALDAVERRYDVDEDRQVITGGSLGGYGATRLAAIYPDIFAGAFAHCPTTFENSFGAGSVGKLNPSSVPFVLDPLIASLLNVRYVHAAGTLDPLAFIVQSRRIRDRAIAGDLDYRYTEYIAGGHCWDNAEAGDPWILNHGIEYADLMTRPRATAPARVRYVVDPRQYFAAPEPLGLFDVRDIGIGYDAAYWVSRLRVRPELEALAGSSTRVGEEVVATIDAASHARAGRVLSSVSCGNSTGVGGAAGGNPDLRPRNPTPHQYQCRGQTVSQDAPAQLIELLTSNLAAAAIDVPGAGADTSAPLRIIARGDGPLDLILLGLAGSADGLCLAESAADAEATRLSLELDSEPCTIEVTP
ncbi:MAG: alpha/beta hydrolase-fold protein, partial [Candidatus Binatia bacterium]